MRLRVKNFNWIAGRPVVILNSETAEKLDVHVDERVALSNSKKIYAVVDIFEKIIKNGEIGLSNEILKILKVKSGSIIEVDNAPLPKATLLIRKKLNGERLTKEEINSIVSDIVHNNLTEAEVAYFTAAEKAFGMSAQEIINLTKAMVENGNKLKFNQKLVADKHCAGGVAGNRTTPIVVSICAVAGLTVPKTSSRAITSASGTADVIETIANVEFSGNKLKKIVNKTGACLAWGGGLGLAPSDDKIIHVERLLNLDIEPQLLSSIMSKKIAAGSKYLLIDIPYGKGTKSPAFKKAKDLGRKFEKLGKYFKMKLKVVYTDGKQPIGNGIGPVLEMIDVLSVLQNKTDAPEDLKKKSLYLASELLALCGIKDSKKKAKEILESGKAYEKFKEIINIQNNKEKNSCDFDLRINNLKPAQFKKAIYSRKTGIIKEIDNKKINSLCRILGTPENKAAGCYLHKHIGKISKGDKLVDLYSESKDKIRDAVRFFNEFKPIVIK